MKVLCKYVKSKVRFEDIIPRISSPDYFCSKCLRASREKRILCSPIKIDEIKLKNKKLKNKKIKENTNEDKKIKKEKEKVHKKKGKKVKKGEVKEPGLLKVKKKGEKKARKKDSVSPPVRSFSPGSRYFDKKKNLQGIKRSKLSRIVSMNKSG